MAGSRILATDAVTIQEVRRIYWEKKNEEKE